MRRRAGVALIVVTLLPAAAGCFLFDADRDSYVEANMKVVDSLPRMPGAQFLGIESDEFRRGESGPIDGYITVVMFAAPMGERIEDVVRFYEEALVDGWEVEHPELAATGATLGADGRPQPLSQPSIVMARFTAGDASVTVVPGLFGEVEAPAGTGAAFFLVVDHGGAERSR